MNGVFGRGFKQVVLHDRGEMEGVRENLHMRVCVCV